MSQLRAIGAAGLTIEFDRKSRLYCHPFLSHGERSLRAHEEVKAFEKTAFQFFGFRLEDRSQAKSGFVAAYMKEVTFGLFHPEARRCSANLLEAETVWQVAVARFEA